MKSCFYCKTNLDVFALVWWRNIYICVSCSEVGKFDTKKWGEDNYE